MGYAACAADSCYHLRNDPDVLAADCLCKEPLVVCEPDMDSLHLIVPYFYVQARMTLNLAYVLDAYVCFLHIPNSLKHLSKTCRKDFSNIGQPATLSSTFTMSYKVRTFLDCLNFLIRNSISFFLAASKSFLCAAGMPTMAHEPIATSFLQLALIFLSSSASSSEAIAPSTKATSRSSIVLFFFRTRICLKSIFF